MKKLLESLSLSFLLGSSVLIGQTPAPKEQPSQEQEVSPQIKRQLLAKALLAGNLQHRKEMGLDSGNLDVHTEGPLDTILVVFDQNEDVAAGWLLMFQKDPGKAAYLVQMGFKAFILKNNKHGIFTLDLLTGEMTKEEPSGK